MTERLGSENKVVGAKQVRRAIDLLEAQIVYIANDADDKIVLDIKKKCVNKEIPIVYVKNMAKLGKICGIDINAAVAALLKK